MREVVDEVDIVFHQHAEQHVVLGALDGDQLIQVRANIHPLRADADLHWEVQRIEEVLVAILYPLALTSAHEVEVNRLTGNDGAEAPITHDDHIIAQFREEEAILCGSGFGWSLFLGVLSRLIIRITLHSWWLSRCLHGGVIALWRSRILRVISWHLASWRSALALAIAKLADWPSWWLLIVG